MLYRRTSPTGHRYHLRDFGYGIAEQVDGGLRLVYDYDDAKHDLGDRRDHRRRRLAGQRRWAEPVAAGEDGTKLYRG